ncbi:glycosyltransferase family 4 protein [Sphingomonas nostoxanthinifaciens]|uniref:glycosyltransferase family 4 protein n=1 Tax=Sphingomonas nostoxanthinifaciens TaxID=2872652 RepID=UPI001CC1DAF6|nr:glycosyltransferase family 1 protein [Sphingomonas nostoxanthinifaciens]UAK24973.1 glycosyltransferase family 4 protein [Sphingomonas nostoxanthinifaciens]
MQKIARPIAMESRMLAGAGSGVGTYAAALRDAIATLTDAPLILADDAPPVRYMRQRRWARALWPGARTARTAGAGRMIAPDIFRLAQIYVDVHRRLLPVQIPGPPGIMHWTYPVPLRVEGWANLYTVHDVIPLTHPDLSPIPAARHRRILDLIAASATRLVTVSQAARDEIVRVLACPADRVVDCGEAVTVTPADAPLPDGLVSGGYLLVVGSVEPRKNIARLCAAYAASGTTLPLVIVGKDGPEIASLAAALATPGVVRLPYLPPATLTALIGQARALLMPSLAEGFGLPVVEAMALGTPVLTSDHGALAETAGGAALLADPHDVSALAAAIRRIATDDALCADLAARGTVNAHRFTPARFGERLDALYRAVASAPA